MNQIFALNNIEMVDTLLNKSISTSIRPTFELCSLSPFLSLNVLYIFNSVEDEQIWTEISAALQSYTIVKMLWE